MRGLFTAGVLDVLMERSVKFDGLVGVSAGACFGCNYKSGQVGRVIRYNKRFARDPRYCSWKSLFTTGDLFGAEFCYRTLPMELDVFDAAAYEANPMEFHIVATDCATGRAVYRRLDKADERAFDWIRALLRVDRLRVERGGHDASARIPQVPDEQNPPAEAAASPPPCRLQGAYDAPRLVQRGARVHRRARCRGRGHSHPRRSSTSTRALPRARPFSSRRRSRSRSPASATTRTSCSVSTTSAAKPPNPPTWRLDRCRACRLSRRGATAS